MRINIFQTNLEQNNDERLPSHIQRIVSSTAKEFIRRHKTTDPALQRKILELAHINLHMKIYQRHGAQSDETMTTAYEDLTKRIAAHRA